MVQWVKYRLCKHEVLSLDPQQPQKSRYGHAHCNLSTARQTPRTDSTTLAQSNNSRFRRNPVSRNKVGESWQDSSAVKNAWCMGLGSLSLTLKPKQRWKERARGLYRAAL